MFGGWLQQRHIRSRKTGRYGSVIERWRMAVTPGINLFMQFLYHYYEYDGIILRGKAFVNRNVGIFLPNSSGKNAAVHLDAWRRAIERIQFLKFYFLVD